jgi:hypothetical protein
MARCDVVHCPIGAAGDGITEWWREGKKCGEGGRREGRQNKCIAWMSREL